MNDCVVFFFNDTATTEIYTLSLHDALPIYFPIDAVFLLDGKVEMVLAELPPCSGEPCPVYGVRSEEHTSELQSPVPISYAVFCLKKKKIV